MNDQVARLLKNLLRKTKSRRAAWHSTRQRQEYACRLESGIVLVDRFRNESGVDGFDLTVQNHNGERIVYLSSVDLADDEQRRLLQELHQAVVDQALNISATLESMIAELENSSSVGSKEAPIQFGDDIVY